MRVNVIEIENGRTKDKTVKTATKPNANILDMMTRYDNTKSMTTDNHNHFLPLKRIVAIRYKLSSVRPYLFNLSHISLILKFGLLISSSNSSNKQFILLHILTPKLNNGSPTIIYWK